MTIRDDAIEIPVQDEALQGTLISPTPLVPGVLFFQGWNSSQAQYLPRAREIASLGCFCLTFEPRGVAADDPRSNIVTREDNLHDILAAYDALAARPGLDPEAIGVVGSSYGAYLAAILTAQRPVRWLALRVLALYKDEDWDVPKALLDRDALTRYRNSAMPPESNRALRSCAAFRGDVLIVRSEHDHTIPPPVITNPQCVCVGALRDVPRDRGRRSRPAGGALAAGVHVDPRQLGARNGSRRQGGRDGSTGAHRRCALAGARKADLGVRCRM